MTTPEQIAGLTELENLVTQLEAWEGMISAGYQCPAAGISMLNAAKHLADIAHKLRTGKLIVVDHPQATSPVDEPINATDAAFMAGEAIYQRDGVSPFLREIMQLKRDNDAKPVDDRGGAVCEQWAVEAVDREAAWPYRPSCYKIDDYSDWMAGNYDLAATVIKGFAHHRQAPVKNKL